MGRFLRNVVRDGLTGVRWGCTVGAMTHYTTTQPTPLDAYRDAVRRQSHAIGRGFVGAVQDWYDDAVEIARDRAAHAGATGEQLDDANDDGFNLYCTDLGLS